VAGWSGSFWDGAGLRQVHAVGQGGWRYASEEGPGAVLSSANGGVLARGVGKEVVDPRAGRNRSGMIRTPRVRASDLDRDQGRRADPQISPQSSASIANCCTKLARTSLNPS
jgi:hypothetical protein